MQKKRPDTACFYCIGSLFVIFVPV
ncbi:DUF3953 domain-containing protein [Agathobaculum sp.]